MATPSFPQQDSTTSPNAVPLPASPNGTQSDLEVLIDLLGTDEPGGQEPGHTVKMSEISSKPLAANDLRDEGGRLDFVKIKALFSSNSINTHGSSATSLKASRVDEVVEHAQSENAAAAIVLDPPVPTSEFSSSSLARSRPPIDNVDSLGFGSELPPVAVESTPNAGNIDLIDLSSDHPPWASNFNDASILAIPSSSYGVQPGPVSQKAPTSLPSSLALAQEEVAGLRKRVRELDDLIINFRDQVSPRREQKPELEDGRSFQEPLIGNSHQSLHAEARPHRDVEEPKVHRSRMTNEISQVRDLSSLSLAQTRTALKNLLDDLALSPSCFPILLKESRKSRTMPTLSLEEIHRALDMVPFLDELVWRRSCVGAIYDNPYSEENIQALRDRIELWEKTVRTRR